MMKSKFLTLQQLLPSEKKFPSYSLNTSSFYKEFLPLPFSNTRIGIEVEVEKCPMTEKFNELQWWLPSEDPSLRNYGLEFKSKGPIASAQDVSKALFELDEVLKSRKPKVDFSFRTGDHVHLCMLQFTLPRILNLFLLYNFLEPYLFEAFCPKRRYSNFCVPIGEGQDEIFRKSFSSMLEAYSKKEFSFDWSQALKKFWSHTGLSSNNQNYINKYSAINPSRIRDIGTIEFRHMPGTGDFLSLRDWISTLVSLAEFSYTSNFEKLMKRIVNLDSLDKIEKLLDEILPKEIQKQVQDSCLIAGMKQAKLFLSLITRKEKEEQIIVKKSGKLYKAAEEIQAKKLARLKNSFS